ncbi:uncharacterized protein Dana_GF19742 [Drosophila ananassae]|uniref:Hexosyltransferase n=1 Tax=Drosophila ananassae TaxID=7217 RepID=B3N027_DROAN|nr:beta-1,3-galactosyltransferase 6 [Drosophila ananassae]EDV35393.1 uncharacterized protein Dana_GF19742 [Drosophila ananassae]
MRRLKSVVTFIVVIAAFSFGSFITKILILVEKCPAEHSGLHVATHADNFLLVLVLSSPRNMEQRNAIRGTWLRLSPRHIFHSYYPEELLYLPNYGPNGHLEIELVEHQEIRLKEYINWKKSSKNLHSPKRARKIKVKHMFAIGTMQLGKAIQDNLYREQGKHNDLLLLPNHYDTYYNLTEKILQAMNVLTQTFEFSYLIKVDDDTYVKLDTLINELISYDNKLLHKEREYGTNPLPQLYWGYFNGRATIKLHGQWKEYNYYLSKNYLPYALGGGYVLSRKLCEYISNNSQILSLYASEDVSVGTWLAPLRNVYRWHDPRFDTAFLPRKCKSYHIVLHKRSMEMMAQIFDGKLCSGTGHSSVLEYYYDWTKTADKCCDNLVP